jgi:hypothetical protein
VTDEEEVELLAEIVPRHRCYSSRKPATRGRSPLRSARNDIVRTEDRL